MMKSLILLIIVIAPTCSQLFAQTKELDSLKMEVDKHPQRDSVRVNLIVDYIMNAINTNTTQSRPLIQELISISRELKFKKGVQLGYVYLQIYYSDRGDFATSSLYADTTIQLLESDTTRWAHIKLGYLHNNLGGDNLKMGDYQKSIEHYTKAAEILEKYNPEVVASPYGGLSSAYEALSQFDKAFEYDKRAIAAAERSGSKIYLARTNLNYAERLFNQKHFAEVEDILKKVEPLVIETNDVIAQALFYQIRGAVSQNKKQYARAISDFRKSYQIGLDNDDKYQQISLLDPLVKSLIDAGQMDEAKRLNDTLLSKSVLYQMSFGRVKAYTNMASWYLLRKDYAKAYEFLHMKMELSDSISSDETKNKIAMVETRFRVAEKDGEIKSLQDDKKIQDLQIRQKNTINYLLIGGLAFLLIISLLVYRNYRNRQKLQQAKIDELETEKKLTAAEAVLKGEEQERTRLAKDLHDGLGGMLSGIKFSLNNMKDNLIMTPDNMQAFERSIDMLDSSIKEMRRVAHNMMPEILVKYGLDKALSEYCSEIDRSGVIRINYQSVGMSNVNIAQTENISIYRIVQELVNNAIKHSAAQNVLVQLHHSVEEKILAVTVEDDGKGFDTAILKQPSGIGWNNIQSRVDFLKGKLDIQSAPGNGTSVMIEINNV